MKKVISVVLVAVVLACVGMGFAGCDDVKLFAPKLEKQIVGTWVSESGLLSYTFREDGTMSGNVEIIGVVSVNGTYSVDNDTNQLTLTYTAFSLSYNDVKTATIEDDVLTITDATLGTTSTYYKEVTE